MVGLNNVLFTFGVGTTTASNTALIYATPPLWGMLLGFLLGTRWASVGGGSWAAVAYPTLFVAAFGFSAWQGGVSRIGANRVLSYINRRYKISKRDVCLFLREEVYGHGYTSPLSATCICRIFSATSSPNATNSWTVFPPSRWNSLRAIPNNP